MRIIAGRWRGLRLAAVGKGDAGAHLRPTPDRVRESLFSMLTHMGVLEDARVLDLFAGTGALGLEALSRGAGYAVLVEKGRTGQRLIAENINKMGTDDAALVRQDVMRAGLSGAPFDLVFLDPPYGQGLGAKALDAVRDHIAPGATVIWEEEAFQPAPDGYAVQDTRRFGTVSITVLERLAG